MPRSLIPALVMAVVTAGTAQAQEFLTRAEVQAHMETSVFCYYPDDRTACGWAELYVEQLEDQVELYTASANWPDPMMVERYILDWRGDALCIPPDDQGLRAMLQAEGYRFPFNLEGLTELDPDGLPVRIAELAENAPREFCFQYTADPEVPGQLLQHVFRDGTFDAELDPVALVPRFASGVAIRPQ